MKKLILAVIVTLGVTTAAMAQKTFFDEIEKLTKENHYLFVPKNYKLVDEKDYIFVYSDGGDKFISLIFDKKGVVSISTNDKKTSGLDGYVFEEIKIKGVNYSVLWLKGQFIIRQPYSKEESKFIFFPPNKI